MELGKPAGHSARAALPLETGCVHLLGSIRRWGCWLRAVMTSARVAWRHEGLGSKDSVPMQDPASVAGSLAGRQVRQPRARRERRWYETDCEKVSVWTQQFSFFINSHLRPL